MSVFMGVICKRTTDLTGQNITAGTTPINWDAEEIDTDGSHSTSVNTSRITIPSAYNGKYGIFTGTLEITNIGANASTVYLIPRIFKNGATIYTWIFGAYTSDGEGTFQHTVSSPPALLSTGDYWELTPQQGHGGVGDDTSVDIIAARSCFALQVLG